MINAEGWKEKIAMWIAWHLPRRIVMWCMIRMYAHASQGRWGSDHVEALRYKDVYDRWKLQ